MSRGVDPKVRAEAAGYRVCLYESVPEPGFYYEHKDRVLTPGVGPFKSAAEAWRECVKREIGVER